MFRHASDRFCRSALACERVGPAATLLAGTTPSRASALLQLTAWNFEMPRADSVGTAQSFDTPWPHSVGARLPANGRVSGDVVGRYDAIAGKRAPTINGVEFRNAAGRFCRHGAELRHASDRFCRSALARERLGQRRRCRQVGRHRGQARSYNEQRKVRNAADQFY